MLAHRPQPFANTAPDAGVDHCDAPVLLRIAEDLDLVAEPLDDAVGVGLRLVVQKIFLDDIGLVAKAQDEVLVTKLAVVVHQVPEDRLVPDRNHRLRNALGYVPNARAETAAEQNGLHLSGLCSWSFVSRVGLTLSVAVQGVNEPSGVPPWKTFARRRWRPSFEVVTLLRKRRPKRCPLRAPIRYSID